MKRKQSAFLAAVIILSLIIIVAVCWHSVEEIHYLKSFYPKRFSVQEAFYASSVELVKVVIISLPLFLIIATALYSLRHFRKKP